MALCGALTVAELAGALPRSGGIFAYLLEAYGPLPAFLFGWTELVVIRASALGAIATIFAEYLGYFVPLTAAPRCADVAAAAIVVIGASTTWACSAPPCCRAHHRTQYAALLALGLLAFTARGGSASHFSPAWSAGISVSLLATALIPVLWTYDGWADPATMAGEIADPQRNLPRALIAGALCVTLVYLVVNVGFLYALSPGRWPAPGSSPPRSPPIPAVRHGRDGGDRRRGDRVRLQRPQCRDDDRVTRVLRDGRPRPVLQVGGTGVAAFPQPLGRHLAGTALGVAYVLENDFAQLADKFILGIWPFYALTVAAVFVLRPQAPATCRARTVSGAIPWCPRSSSWPRFSWSSTRWLPIRTTPVSRSPSSWLGCRSIWGGSGWRSRVVDAAAAGRHSVVCLI